MKLKAFLSLSLAAIFVTTISTKTEAGVVDLPLVELLGNFKLVAQDDLIVKKGQTSIELSTNPKYECRLNIVPANSDKILRKGTSFGVSYNGSLSMDLADEHSVQLDTDHPKIRSVIVSDFDRKNKNMTVSTIAERPPLFIFNKPGSKSKRRSNSACGDFFYIVPPENLYSDFVIDDEERFEFFILSEEDEPEGTGVGIMLFNRNGIRNVYRGGVDNMAPHGKGIVELNSEGLILEGSWLNGDMHGSFQVLVPDGSTEEWFFEHDERIYDTF